MIYELHLKLVQRCLLRHISLQCYARVLSDNLLLTNLSIYRLDTGVSKISSKFSLASHNGLAPQPIFRPFGGSTTATLAGKPGHAVHAQYLHTDRVQSFLKQNAKFQNQRSKGISWRTNCFDVRTSTDVTSESRRKRN